MRIGQIGESGLIQKILAKSSRHLSPGLIGIGDDAAVLSAGPGPRQVVTTDLLVEGTHFRRDWSSAGDVGAKSLAVNLSDIAAMGAKPSFAFLSLGLSPDLDVAWIEAFLTGFFDVADEFGVALMGGDTCGSRCGIVINVCLMGNAPHPRLRSTARAGDLFCVTGTLGDSAAGLRQLQNGNAHEARLVGRHLRPQPRVAEGQWLATQPGVHAMMDISDGIHLDLPRILAASACGAEVEISKVPLSTELRAVAAAQSWDANALALGGGEDYELLLAVAPAAFTKMQHDFTKEFSLPLTAIGFATEKRGDFFYTRHGKAYAADIESFDHFTVK